MAVMWTHEGGAHMAVPYGCGGYDDQLADTQERGRERPCYPAFSVTGWRRLTSCSCRRGWPASPA